MLPIKKQLTNFNKSPRTQKAVNIIIHDVGEVSTAKNNADYFCSGNKEASADFFVDSNNIYQIIDYNVNYSWQIGDGHDEFGKSNQNSVGIEMCLEADRQPSAMTIQNTLDLTHYLMSTLGIPISNVFRHYDCSHKLCPSSFVANNWEKWGQFRTALSGGTVSPSVVGSSVELQELLNKLGFKGQNGKVLGTDGILGVNSKFAVETFQKAKGLTADGIAGVNTWNALRKAVTPVAVAKPVATPVAKPIVKPVVVAPVATKVVTSAKVLAYQKLCNALGIRDAHRNVIVCDGILGVNTQSTYGNVTIVAVGSKSIIVGFVQKIVGTPVDNGFGSATEIKVMAYQTAHKIKADGICGVTTYKALVEG